MLYSPHWGEKEKKEEEKNEKREYGQGGREGGWVGFLSKYSSNVLSAMCKKKTFTNATIINWEMGIHNRGG